MNSLIGLTFLMVGIGVAGDPPPKPTDPSSVLTRSATWSLERVELKDHRRFEGYIESEDDAWVHLIQIQRNRGPMHLVIRPIERSSIASVVKLDAEKRQELRQRIEQFLNRSSIEAGRMDAVVLQQVRSDDLDFLEYRGKWFTLQSTLDEMTTRRMVVRLEQIFTAYRQVKPPRREPVASPRFILFGSMTEYRRYLARLGLDLQNPACYLRERNIVVLGSDLARFASEMSKVQARHVQLRKELEDLEKQIRPRLQDIAKQLQQSGNNKKEVVKLLQLEKRKAEELLDKKEQEIKRADRENSPIFAKASQSVVERLYHEAFHAYWENFVYPHQDFDVPLWLEEGLATVFEKGMIESDSLRIDIPNEKMLKIVKAELGTVKPKKLEGLFSTTVTDFLVSGETPSPAVEKNYAYSWGVVYYLLYEKSNLSWNSLDEYVSPSARTTPPVKRFETLTKVPLEQFESDWRDFILQRCGISNKTAQAGRSPVGFPLKKGGSALVRPVPTSVSTPE